MIAAEGVRIVPVTQGDARQAEALCRRMDVPFTCYADPARSGYQSYDLKKSSLLSLNSPVTIARGVEAAFKGYLPQRVVGDAFQLGGTFLIDQQGIVRWTHIARYAADHPSATELVAAVRALTQADSRA